MRPSLVSSKVPSVPPVTVANQTTQILHTTDLILKQTDGSGLRGGLHVVVDR